MSKIKDLENSVKELRKEISDLRYLFVKSPLEKTGDLQYYIGLEKLSRVVDKEPASCINCGYNTADKGGLLCERPQNGIMCVNNLCWIPKVTNGENPRLGFADVGSLIIVWNEKKSNAVVIVWEAYQIGAAQPFLCGDMRYRNAKRYESPEQFKNFIKS